MTDFEQGKSTVHIIPREPLPPDIEHTSETSNGEFVTWSSQMRRDDCPLCRAGRCTQKVRSGLNYTLVVHGTVTQ